YDMFLRFAFHVPFLFVEGNVAINRVNPAGVFNVRLAGDLGYGKFLPKVVEKSLAMLPDSPYSRQLSREVHVALVPRIVCMLERLPDVEEKRSYMRTVLQACPWMLRDPAMRACLVANVYFFTRGSSLPIASVEAICQEIMSTAAGGGFRERLKMRLLL